MNRVNGDIIWLNHFTSRLAVTGMMILIPEIIPMASPISAILRLVFSYDSARSWGHSVCICIYIKMFLYYIVYTFASTYIDQPLMGISTQKSLYAWSPGDLSSLPTSVFMIGCDFLSVSRGLSEVMGLANYKWMAHGKSSTLC